MPYDTECLLLYTKSEICLKIILGNRFRGMSAYARYCVNGYILLSLIIVLCTGYVYRVNLRRKADDPEKRNYHPAAIPLTLLWPIFLLVTASLYILKALAYGIFLILFTVALVVIRKPFIIKLMLKLAAKIGAIFLKANTFIIQAFLPKPQPNTA